MGGERILELADFHKRTGILTYHKLRRRGIEPSYMTGAFYTMRANELLELCKMKPKLHIISEMGMAYVNRFEQNATGYLLGNGDKDPTLEISFQFPTPEEFAWGLEQVLKVPEEKRTWIHKISIKIFSAAAGGVDMMDAGAVKKIVGA